MRDSKPLSKHVDLTESKLQEIERQICNGRDYEAHPGETVTSLVAELRILRAAGESLTERYEATVSALRDAQTEIERLQGELEAQRMHRAGYLRNTEKLNEAEAALQRIERVAIDLAILRDQAIERCPEKDPPVSLLGARMKGETEAYVHAEGIVRAAIKGEKP